MQHPPRSAHLPFARSAHPVLADTLQTVEVEAQAGGAARRRGKGCPREPRLYSLASAITNPLGSLVGQSR